MARSQTFLAASLLTTLALGTAVRAQQPAPSQADLERRVQELEATVHQLQAARPTLTLDQSPEQLPAPGPSTSPGGSKASPESQRTNAGTSADGKSDSSGEKKEDKKDDKKDDKKTIVAGWDDGFILRSSDKCYQLRITGQIQTDYRAFLEEADQVDIDTFLIRRARFGLEADMFKNYEFRLLPDFGQGTVKLLDAYMNIHYWDELMFEIGKFKQPVSYEQLIQDRFVPTLERSMIDQLVPARDVGAMIWGRKVFFDRLDYAVSVSNGQINGDQDTNEHKDVDGRVVVRPFNSPEFLPWAHRLGLGVSGGYGVEQEPVQPNTLRTPATVPWFKFNSNVVEDGVRWRLTPELTYFYNSFGLAAQYYREAEELRPAATGSTSRFRQDVPFAGFYVLTTYLLTGEHRTDYSEAITPRHPFAPWNAWECPGAWELVGRVSRLEVGERVFMAGRARLADPALYSHAAIEMTLGFNWYFNKWARMQFNWEHAWFDDPVRLGPSARNYTKDSDALLTRFQIIF